MDINEIKKELYKQKPVAQLVRVTKSGLHYMAVIKEPTPSGMHRHTIFFLVPFSEIGDATFVPQEPESHLLIRYLVTPEQTPIQ